MSEFTVELPCGCVAGPDGEETKITFCDEHQPTPIALEKVDEFREILAEIEGYEMNPDWEISSVTADDGLTVRVDPDDGVYFEIEMDDEQDEKEQFMKASSKIIDLLKDQL